MTDLSTAEAMHQKFQIVDCHHDIELDVNHQRRLGRKGVLSGHWGPMLQKGGVNVQILPLWAPNRLLPEMGGRYLLTAAEGLLIDLEEDDSIMRLATTMSEIDAAVADDRIAAVLAIEGCDGLAGDPALLRVLYRLGVRIVGFTWNRRNEFADGVGEGEDAGGLSEIGKIALMEMFEHRVIPDVSHLSDRAFWDVVELAEGPFVATHSNARAICDHPRNLTDDQLRALAEAGGVTGLNFYGGFVDPDGPTLDRLMDHLGHIVETVGIDYVGIGPDFLEDYLMEEAKVDLPYAGIDPSLLDLWMPDCYRIEQLPAFTAAMLDRGLSEEDIEKVLGGNFMRVFRQVWS